MKNMFTTALTALVLATASGFSEEVQPAPVTPPPAPAAEVVAPKPEAPIQFLELKDEDIKSYGLNKLSDEERANLEKWVKKYSDAKALPEPVKIQTIQKGAKTIELADGRSFSLSADARKVASEWKVGDFVRVEAGKKKNSFVLFHVPSNKTIKVKPSKETSDKK